MCWDLNLNDLPMHLLNVKWVMYVTQINVAKVTHQSNIRTLIFHPKIIILATLVPYQQEKKEEDVAMEPVLPRLLFLSKKSVLLYCFDKLLWQYLFL